MTDSPEGGSLKLPAASRRESPVLKVVLFVFVLIARSWIQLFCGIAVIVDNFTGPGEADLVARHPLDESGVGPKGIDLL